MATWEPVSYYYSGQGVVLIGERDPLTGKPVGLIPVGNVSDLKIAITTSVLEHKESMTGARGIDLRLTTETKAALSMTMESYNSTNLALALRGGETVIAGGSVVDVAYNGAVQLGKITPLAHVSISALTIDKSATPLVAYVDGMVDGEWDYKVNLDAGSVLWATTPDTAGLVDDDDVTISYTYAAQKKVDALTAGSLERYLRFEGLNTADSNKPVVVEVFKFLVDPLKELALIGDGINQFVLEGNVLADALQTTGSKYFKQMLLR